MLAGTLPDFVQRGIDKLAASAANLAQNNFRSRLVFQNLFEMLEDRLSDQVGC